MGRLPARGLPLRRASCRLRRPKGQQPRRPGNRTRGLLTRAQARCHRGRGPHSGKLVGSPPVTGRQLAWHGEHQRVGSGYWARRRQRRRTVEAVWRGAVKAARCNGIRRRRRLRWMVGVPMGLSDCKGARGGP
jgi:hypothetical protein